MVLATPPLAERRLARRGGDLGGLIADADIRPSTDQGACLRDRIVSDLVSGQAD